MTNSQLTIYPCGLIAQWIEHCTGITRSWVRVPSKPEFFQVGFLAAKVESTLRGSQFHSVSTQLKSALNLTNVKVLSEEGRLKNINFRFRSGSSLNFEDYSS